MSEDRTDRIIDAIDGALEDYSVSGDAMRWTPEPVEGELVYGDPLPIEDLGDGRSGSTAAVVYPNTWARQWPAGTFVSAAELDRLLAETGEAAVPVAREERPAFTCPRCGRTSHNPNDAREGYCGACHDWTRALPDEWADNIGYLVDEPPVEDLGDGRHRLTSDVIYTLPAGYRPAVAYQYVPPLPPPPIVEAYMGEVRVSWAPLDERTRERVREQVRGLYQRAQVVEPWDEGEGYEGTSVLSGLRGVRVVVEPRMPPGVIALGDDHVIRRLVRWFRRTIRLDAEEGEPPA